MIKKRLEHAVFLMGMLFITLLTSSANAFAQNHTVTGGEGIKTVSNIAAGTNSFTLIAEEGYTLPTALGTLAMGETALTSSDVSDPADTYTYTPADGNVVINKEGGIIANITFTAGGVEKDIATLATFTYSVTGGVKDQAVTGFTPDKFNTSGYTVDLDTYIPEATVITVVGTETAESGATVKPTDGTIKDGASIKVTAKNGTEKTYTVAFTVATAKITSVTEPKDQTLDQIYATFELAKAKLPQTMVITAEDGTSSLDLVWTMKSGSYNPASGATNTFVWTATVPGTLDATDVSVTGEVTVANFTTPLSTDNKLSALTYRVPAGPETSVTGFKPEDTGAKEYAVELPSTTSPTAEITVAATAATGATFKVEDKAVNSPFAVTLADGKNDFTFSVVAEDGTTKRNVTIKFTTATAETVTEVVVPKTYALTKAVTDAPAAIALLNAMPGVTIKTSTSATTLELKWEYTGSSFNKAAGATNIFDWKVETVLTAAAGVSLSGTTTVTNYEVILEGDQSGKDVVTGTDPVDKIGNGIDETTVKSLTVNSNATITFDKVEMTGDVTVSTTNTATFILKEDNVIPKIINNGTLTLKNATAATSTSSIATRAVTNTGAVKAVENNGTFTDETGTILTVSGTNSLEITILPTSQLNITGQSATLTVATTGATKYQWMKNGVAVGTDAATLTVNKADGAGSYICEVSNAGTHLMTPAVTVSFQGTTPPPTPTTYVVSLPAVTGATFSKGVSTTVTEGGDFAFQITLDKDYNLSVPVVKINRNNNEVITAVAGVYTVSNVRGDLIVTVTGITKNIPTGIDDVNSGTRIWAAGSTLHIFTEATENVYVFNASGVLQKQFRTPGGDYTTQMNEGLYIVKIGNYTQKVIIK